MADADATLVIEPDEPAFAKAIEEMAKQMEARFQKSGVALKSTFETATSGLAPGQSFTQSPVAMTTKEMEKQLKWAKEITKTERERREIARARRFEQNRSRYGDDIELDENGNMKRWHGAQAGMRRVVGGVATGVNALSTLAFGGGSAQSGLQAGNMIGNVLAPEIAPILNAITGVAMSALNASDTRVESMLRAYQVGGFRGAAQAQGNVENMANYREWTGFDLERFSNLQTNLGRKTGGLNNLPVLMGAENSFGIANNAVNMLGANVHSGHSASSKDQEHALGSAMALAMGQGMERGRMGEVFDQLTRAMEANTKGVSDIEGIADRFLFISQLGPQYRGDTNASREMNQSITQLSQGTKPYTQIAMLRAAGFGKPGVSYAQAWLKTQAGLDVAGGVSSEELIKANFASYIPQYARGNEAQKASIIMILSQLTGMNGAQVKVIMDRLASGPLAHVDAAAGYRRLNAEANMTGDADKLLRVRQQATIGENRKAGFGNFVAWTAGQGDRRDALGSNPAVEADAGNTGTQSGPAMVGGGGSQQFSQYRSAGGRFGVRRGDTGGMPGGKHPGEDLFFPPGTTVYSPCNGTVIVFGYFSMPGAKVEKANGYAIWIKSDDDGLVWQFVHIDPQSTTLRRGAKVRKGDKIGTTLNFKTWTNGQKTHLHLGVQRNGEQIDPMGFDLSSITQPVVGQVKTSAGATQSPATVTTSPSGTAGANGGGASSSGPVTSPSQVQVQVTITDRTSHGVDVHHETQSYARQAMAPAPGDAPITHPDQVP